MPVVSMMLMTKLTKMILITKPRGVLRKSCSENIQQENTHTKV